MIKPLKIGPHTFSNNLIQGPLAGYTCAAMRRQTWQWSQPAYCSTEMVSANHLANTKKLPLRYIERDPNERALCFQLAAENPKSLEKAVKIVNTLRPEIIELNCGCPVNKIRRRGAGSKLLSEPAKLQELVKCLRNNTDAAISIKIRVSGDEDDQDDVLLANIIEQEGADALVVHGRHWSENYDTRCRYAQIKRLVDAVKIPVIGNGDVHDFNSLMTMLNLTNCAGVMIGRASMGQPWLFAELTAQFQQENFSKPTPKIIAEIFIDHIERLAKLDNEYRAVLQARKMGKYYARNAIHSNQEFLMKLMQCTKINQFTELVRHYFE